MKEINKIKKLLTKYKKSKDEKVKSNLQSFIIKCELEIMNERKIDKDFRPTTGDKFQDKRDIIKEIREELDLLGWTKDQHPPKNIEDIRKRIAEMGTDQPPQKEE